MSVYRPITGQKVPPTYTETKNFVSTKFQKGKEVLPRELNEWQDIKDMSTKGLFSDILGNLFIGDAFAVKQAAITANDFSIASGTLYTRFGPILAENKLYSEVSTNTWMKVVQEPDQFIEDFTYGDLTEGQRALTTPTAGNRIDLVVLVITKREIDATYDTDIKNAVLGHETAVREKLFFTVRVLPNFNMNNIATFESLFSYYNDEYCIRIPIAQITRLQNNDNILDSQIIDLRHIVLSNNIYDTLKNYIDIDIQGANKGFNADKVDGKDVNDLRDASPDVLWTSAKILEAINAYAKGISPQPGIIGRFNPAIDPEVQSPVAVWEDGHGSRFISNATVQATILGIVTSFEKDELYEYVDVGGGVFQYVSQNAQTGWLLEDKNLVQNIIKSVDGTWFSFGGVSNHNSLSGILFAKLNSGVDDIVGFDTEDPKHVTSEYMDTIELRLVANAGGVSTNETNLNNHTALEITNLQEVHGIQQGSGNGFDADKLDGAELTTTMTTSLDTLVPTQKAVKDHLSANYVASGGGTITGDITITSETESTGPGVASLSTLGGIYAGKKSILNKGLDLTLDTAVPTLGDELVTNAVDRDFSSGTGTNWTNGSNGWSIASGYYNRTASGGSATLSAYPPVPGKTYEISFSIYTTAGTDYQDSFRVYYGSQYTEIRDHYMWTLYNTRTYTFTITPTSTDYVVITPSSAWAGRLDNFSIKELTVRSSEKLSIISAGAPTGYNLGLGPFGGVFIGSESLAPVTARDASNTIVGKYSGPKLTTGESNTLIGTQAGYTLSEGYSNTFIGAYTGGRVTTGKYNVAIGKNALYLAGADDSIVIGAESCMNVGYLYNCTVIGNKNLYESTGGGRFQFTEIIGSNSPAENGGTRLKSASQCIYIGSFVKSAAESANNEIVIGYGAVGNGANSVTLGNSTTQYTYLKGTVYGSFEGWLQGNATSATSAGYWTTARTLTVSGDATGSVSIRGNANMSLSLDVTYATSAGSASSASSATRATAADNIKITATASNSTFYIPFTNYSSSGDRTMYVDSGGGLQYNPYENQLKLQDVEAAYVDVLGTVSTVGLRSEHLFDQYSVYTSWFPGKVSDTDDIPPGVWYIYSKGSTNSFSYAFDYIQYLDGTTWRNLFSLNSSGSLNEESKGKILFSRGNNLRRYVGGSSSSNMSVILTLVRIFD